MFLKRAFIHVLIDVTVALAPRRRATRIQVKGYVGAVRNTPPVCRSAVLPAYLYLPVPHSRQSRPRLLPLCCQLHILNLNGRCFQPQSTKMHLFLVKTW